MAGCAFLGKVDPKDPSDKRRGLCRFGCRSQEFVGDSFKVAEMGSEPDMFIGTDGNAICAVHVQPDRRDRCLLQRCHHSLACEYISDCRHSFLLRPHLNAGNRHQLPVPSNSAKKAGLQLTWRKGDPTSSSVGIQLLDFAAILRVSTSTSRAGAEMHRGTFGSSHASLRRLPKTGFW
jgi:hypothetical protein